MQINSASIDHTKLGVGLHLAETLEIGGQNVYSYDLRFKHPVRTQVDQDILDQPTIHAIEHYLAHYLRTKTDPSNIVSFFPYGCATGFGCLSLLPPKEFKSVLVETMDDIVEELPHIPFVDPARCGNAFMFSRHTAICELEDFSDEVYSQTLDSILEVPRLSEDI